MTPEEFKEAKAGDVVKNAQGDEYFILAKFEDIDRMIVQRVQEVGIGGWGLIPGRPQSFIDKLPSTTT